MRLIPVVTFGKRALEARQWQARYAAEELARCEAGSAEASAWKRRLEDEEAAVVGIQRSIAGRTKDTRYHVPVKHVAGLGVLEARTDALAASARKRARVALAEAGDAVSESSVSAALALDVEFAAALEANRDEWLAVGLHDADKERVRLFDLGGDALLFQVAQEIRAFQRIGDDLGEG